MLNRCDVEAEREREGESDVLYNDKCSDKHGFQLLSLQDGF